MSLEVTKKAPAQSTNPIPFVHDDTDDDDAGPMPSAPQDETTSPRPLQNLSPNRSISKPSPPATLSPEKLLPPSRIPSPLKSALPPEPQAPASLRPSEWATAELSDILSRHTASGSSTTATNEAPPRLKKRPLGRAISGESHRFLSALPPDDIGGGSGGGEGTAAAAVRAPPSTQIGYETPEAEAHRLRMSEQMGIALRDEAGMTRVPRIGNVQDAPLMGPGVGVGSRVRGRVKGRQRGLR